MNHPEDNTDLELLRSINAELTADPDALARVRAQLQPATPMAKPRRSWGRTLAAAAAALSVGIGGGVLVASLVPGSDQAPTLSPQRPQTPTTAASFTSEAAAASLLKTPLKPGPKQYRKVVAATTGPASGPVVSWSKDGKRAPQVKDPMATMRLHQVTTTWVPGDPKKDWVRVTQSWLEATDAAGKKYLKDKPRLGRKYTSEAERAKGGAFGKALDGPGWNMPTQGFIDKLPRNPAKLLASATKRNDFYDLDKSPQNLLTMLTIPLQDTWVEDPTLRAAVFEAIGLIKGIELRQDARIGDQTGVSLLGRSNENDDNYSEVLFDPFDHRLIGGREVFAETPKRVYETTYATGGIVDQAP